MHNQLPCTLRQGMLLLSLAFFMDASSNILVLCGIWALLLRLSMPDVLRFTPLKGSELCGRFSTCQS